MKSDDLRNFGDAAFRFIDREASKDCGDGRNGGVRSRDLGRGGCGRFRHDGTMLITAREPLHGGNASCTKCEELNYFVGRPGIVSGICSGGAEVRIAVKDPRTRFERVIVQRRCVDEMGHH